MKICILANGYPNSQNPQSGCFERDQAIALKDLGHKVIFLYFDFKFSLVKHKIEINSFVDNGIHIYGLTGLGIYWFFLIILHLFNFKWNLKYRTKLFERLFRFMLKSEERPDVIYAHYLYNIAYGVNLKKLFRIPLVGIEHWSVLNQPSISPKVQFLGNLAYPQTDTLLAVSDSLSNSIEKYFGKKCIVVNNMVNGTFLTQNNTQSLKDDKIFTFIAIGSLIKRKGFDILIDAFHKTDLASKNCKLIIIGGGNELSNLQNQINRLSLKDSVTLVGRRNKHEIISYLKKSNAFVLSSHVETFSVVCIEAMALGIPVIATACGGPEEFVTEEVGILIKPSDMNALANAMMQMHKNYILYDNCKIAEYCSKKFAPNVISKKITDILNLTIQKYGNE